MALKNSAYKIQSSTATFFFANRDLLHMAKIVSWQELNKIPAPLVRNQEEYNQLIEALRLTSLANHTEIIKQAFYEYQSRLNANSYSSLLEALKNFLLDLRNAFNHHAGELTPRWAKKPHTKGTFKINIPIKKLENGYNQFNPTSKSFILFKMTVKPNKRIKVSTDFINQIYYLSMLVLTITKKRKVSSLTKYLDQFSLK